MSSYEYNFQDRMAQDKARAHERRQRGLPSGTTPAAGWVGIQRQPMSGLDMIEAYYYQFKKDIHYNAYLAVEYALFGHDWEGL